MSRSCWETSGVTSRRRFLMQGRQRAVRESDIQYMNQNPYLNNHESTYVVITPGWTE